ncbi:hypothetical protein CRE_02900 [Caenorhabditis remanei]|uniref:G-protein coupled receptors family 1 profile domain-containing protein n=1 Tax=Caenorhabditis remanei TaxID=31234 RepID=E3LWK9_CAERE|nr:hypothetical protein CRE_02900 [Caenorhabditis remanei]
MTALLSSLVLSSFVMKFTTFESIYKSVTSLEITFCFSEMSTNCSTIFHQAYNPIFRFSSIYQVVISISSIIPLGYFLIFKLLQSTFHWNLKTIFIGYFLSMILFSMFYTITAFIQTIKAFISTDPCDLSVIPFYHKRLLSAISFLLAVSTSSPFLITIERYYAMKTAEKYEKTPVILGPILVGINTLVNFGIMYNIFKDESFSDPSVSFSVYPPAAAQKNISIYCSVMFQIFTFSAILFFLNFIDVLFDIILLRQNIRLKKLLTNSSLTAKYQLEEVYQSTKFSVFLILIHITSFGVYVSAVVFFRYFGSLIISDPYYLFAVRIMCSTVRLLRATQLTREGSRVELDQGSFHS